MTCHYPLALERIVQGHTRITLDPATILISLGPMIMSTPAGSHRAKASGLMVSGGTHGGLDNDVNSEGIVMSNFKPTTDTSSEPGGRASLTASRACGIIAPKKTGAEWVTGQRNKP